jgi:hypothetical protein
MSKLIRSLVAAPLFATLLGFATLPASAALPVSSGGGVGPTGTIGFGSGFTVQHTGTGTYVITYPSSTGFTGIPAVSVTPWGYGAGHFPTANVYYISGSNGGLQFEVVISDKVGKQQLYDNSFMFTLNET